MTGQRRVIARVLSSAKDHPDVEEVYLRANEIDRRISLSTVYRTLKLFEEKGILERHDFGHKRGRYEEASRGHHDHLIDVDTGRVIEFRNEAIEALAGTHCARARLQARRSSTGALRGAREAGEESVTRQLRQSASAPCAAGRCWRRSSP